MEDLEIRSRLLDGSGNKTSEDHFRLFTDRLHPDETRFSTITMTQKPGTRLIRFNYKFRFLSDEPGDYDFGYFDSRMPDVLYKLK